MTKLVMMCLPQMASSHAVVERERAGSDGIRVPVCSEPSCPQCRRQMQSRRDCKRDSRFDRLMKQLYGDLHGFEAQVLLPCAFQTTAAFMPFSNETHTCPLTLSS